MRQARAPERIDTEVAVEAAKECRRTVDAARKLAGKVWTEPDRWRATPCTPPELRAVTGPRVLGVVGRDSY